MNQGFRLRFDQMRESDPTDRPTPPPTPGDDNVNPSPGHARNVCLVWPNGGHFFLNYAYLIGGEFNPDAEKNLIRLNFSSYTVTLQGYSLEALFLALFDHLPRFVHAVDERYVLEEDCQQPVVIEMSVEKNEG